MYKGYYIRKKLKIYFNLPRDLQRKIIWHINSDLYLRHYNSSITKLIYKRHEDFYYKYMYIILEIYKNIYFNTDNFDEFYGDLISLIKISMKYNKILNPLKIPTYYTIKYVCYDMNKICMINNLNNPHNEILQKYCILFD
jgi:hypothetical protein